MTQEEKVQRTFNTQQREQLERAADIIAGPFTDSLAKNTIRKLYFDAVLAAHAAGRLQGVNDAKATMEKVFAEHGAKLE